MPAPRPGRVVPVALRIGVGALAVLAGILLTLLLTREPGVGTATATPTPIPSATVAASATSSASGTPNESSPSPSASSEAGPVVSPPPDVLPVGSRATVVVDSLRIREAPTTDSDVVATVSRGELLFLPDWGPDLRISPITAEDGLDWYAVEHIPGVDEWPNDVDRGSVVQGFVAAQVDGQPLIELAEPRCPPTADIALLTAITAWERLACLGDRELTIEATFGCGVCDALAVPGTFEPAWMAHYRIPIFEQLSPVGHVQQPGFEPIALAFPPEVAAPAGEDRGMVMRLTGHFNDPRAVDCAITIGEGSEVFAVNDTAAEWYCRGLFAVTAWEVIGTDADYPTPP